MFKLSLGQSQTHTKYNILSKKESLSLLILKLDFYKMGKPASIISQGAIFGTILLFLGTIILFFIM